MAFNVTYGNLQTNNIKHLYTTREKTMHQNIPRQKLYRPEMLQLEIQARDRFKKRRANQNRKRRNPNMEYVPEFNIEVPRAPAFRDASREYVDEIVARLTQKPKIKSNPRGCGHYQRGFHEYEWEEEQATPRELVSRRKMHSILDRLTKPGGCGRRHPTPDLTEEDYLPNFTI
ncbi:hypothetical protein ACF0H5_021986 [Mactra antiquata]